MTWKILQWPVVFALVTLGIAMIYCDVNADLPPPPAAAPQPRFTDWVLTGLVFGEAAWLAYSKLRGRLKSVRT